MIKTDFKFQYEGWAGHQLDDPETALAFTFIYILSAYFLKLIGRTLTHSSTLPCRRNIWNFLSEETTTSTKKAIVRSAAIRKTNLSERNAVVSIIMVYPIKLTISMCVITILDHSHIVASTGASLLFPLHITELYNASLGYQYNPRRSLTTRICKMCSISFSSYTSHSSIYWVFLAALLSGYTPRGIRSSFKGSFSGVKSLIPINFCKMRVMETTHQWYCPTLSWKISSLSVRKAARLNQISFRRKAKSNRPGDIAEYIIKLRQNTLPLAIKWSKFGK